MATLHMDVESARSTSTRLSQSVTEIQNIILTLDASIQGLVSEQWKGNSANQFQDEFGQWTDSAKSLIENLEALNNRLATEINEWENMAANLSG